MGKIWLIPWAEIQWQPLYDKTGALNPALKERWDLLQQNDPELSLSFLSTYPGQTASTGKTIIYRGRLVDKATRRGIPTAEVHLIFEQSGEVRFSTTNESGFFEFELAPNPERTEGLLWIHAQAYQILERPVYDLDLVTQLGTIRLDLLPPTPTATVPPTPEPTATPQPMKQVHLIVTGVGFPPKGETNAARRKQYALTAARAKASGLFTQWYKGEDVEEVIIVDQGELKTDLIRIKVKANIPGGTVIEQSYDDATGEAQVTVEYVVEVPE